MKEKRFTIYQICFMALMTALLCILAPMSVPVGPVPVTLATMVIYFTVYVIGPWAGTGSVCIYIMLGMVGLPVFSGYAGGFGKIAGPTGGYILGYIFMALIGGVIIEKTRRNIWAAMFAWVLGTAVLYAFGTAWYIYLTNSGLAGAIGLCVLPFIPGDIAKIVLGTLIGKAVRAALVRGNVITAAVK